MMPFLSLLSSRWLYYVLALAGIIGILWWGQHTIRALEAEKAQLETSLSVAKAAAEQNAETIKQLQADHEKEMAAISSDLAEAQSRAAVVTHNVEVIRHVPVAQTEAVAPVLDAALRCLRLGPGADCSGGAGPKGRSAGAPAASR